MDAIPPLDLVLEMAKVMHEEGFIYSEAYPVVRWRKNGWCEANDKSLFKILDAALLLLRLSDEHKKKHG